MLVFVVREQITMLQSVKLMEQVLVLQLMELLKEQVLVLLLLELPMV